jgi:hypothetical protein
MTTADDFVQVLVLFEEKNAQDYGLAIWAALHEVEQFYKPAAPNLSYRRYLVSPASLQSSFLSQIAHSLGRIFVNATEVSALDVLASENIQPMPKKLRATETSIVDQSDLAETVREVIHESSQSRMMIVTDRAIMPPADWRYIIWDEVRPTELESLPPPPMAVLSLAPLDPLYWREPHDNRVPTIKARARAAALSITGSMLGIESCSDRSCFMFKPVSSVLTLDSMRRFGRGHGRPELEDRGFEAKAPDPTVIQKVLATG